MYGECVAISQTSDATGAYNLYFFDWGPNTFLDYPHIGVWRDGYYLSANEFPTGQETSSGAAAIVLERDKMLAGQPARYVWFDESAANPLGGQYIGQLPGDVDGTKLPPAGEPDVFAEVDDPSGIPPTGTDPGFDLRLWRFHVDWSNPQSSTFGNNGQPSFTLPVAPFVRPQCTYGIGDCPLQKGGPEGLDALGDRLMFRLAYRNFGDHESLVLNHTVHAGALEGIRWYEVRNPVNAPTIYQQGTYAPDDSVTDPLSRWMGSIAMDHSGDIALGFSASGANDYPSIRYTGRAAGDPLGSMTQAEQVDVHGPGPADRTGRTLGRLQRAQRRPDERLHLLVHAGVPDDRPRRDRILGDADRLVPLPRLQVATREATRRPSLRWPPCASPSFSSISTAPSSTPAGSSSRRCATRRARCSAATSATPS